MVDFQNDKSSTPVTLKSASLHKLESIKSPVKDRNISWFRMIGMNILSNFFTMLLYPIYQCETLVLHIDASKKHGNCSSLYFEVHEMWIQK